MSYKLGVAKIKYCQENSSFWHTDPKVTPEAHGPLKYQQELTQWLRPDVRPDCGQACRDQREDLPTACMAVISDSFPLNRSIFCR